MERRMVLVHNVPVDIVVRKIRLNVKWLIVIERGIKALEDDNKITNKK